MAGARVLVHDVDSLELFMETLQAKRDELEALYDILGSELRIREKTGRSTIRTPERLDPGLLQFLQFPASGSG